MKILLSVLIILSSINFSFAQTTSIPDPNFEQALINSGIEPGPIDGVILTAFINSITYLDVSSNNISDLIGIEDFTNLETLQAGSNQLISLDLTQNLLLKNIWVADNQLTSIDVTQNTVLSTLDYNNNQLSSIDVTQNLWLHNLYIGNNQLTSIDVTQNAGLSSLGIDNNQITNLDVSQNPILHHIYSNNNQLSNINLNGATGLWILFCMNNLLTTLDLSQNLALNELYCSGNQISELDVSLSPHLTWLECNNNWLTCLNVKNGNNLYIDRKIAYSNPNLMCVEVDDQTYSNTNWTAWPYTFDNASPTLFNNSCTGPCTIITNIEESNLTRATLDPNPTSGNITIDLGELKKSLKATLTNSLAQVVLTQTHNSTNHINFDLDAP